MAAPQEALALPWRQASWAAARALRPRQWSKNLVLFAGILFAAKLGDAARWGEAASAFVAYCAASSAGYLVNDVRDAPHDRLHPVKRRRPIASGELTVEAAYVLAGVLLALALAVAATLGERSLLFLTMFVALQGAYTFALKEVVLVDVVAIGGLFVLRAAAGAVAVDVRISPWLLACTALLALFLGLAKRRAELLLVGADATPGRRALKGYSLAFVDRLVLVLAVSAVAAYVLYALTARESKEMALTIPFVLFGVLRYLVLVRRRDLGEEPEEVLLSDRPLVATVALWALTSAAVLALS